MKGFTYLVLGGFFAGTIGIWVKLIGGGVSPYLLSFFRIFFVAVLMFFLVAFRRDIEKLMIKRKEVLPFLAAGFLGGTLSIISYVKAMTLAPVSNVVILLYFYPVFAAVLSWFFLKERIKKWEAFAIVLAVAGVWIIYGFEFAGGHMLGNVLALLSGLFYASFMVTTRYFERHGEPYWKVVFWVFFIGGLISILFIPLEPVVFLPDGPVLLFVSCLVVSSFLMYTFYALGLKTVRAHNAPIILLIAEPVTAVVLAWLVLSEVITPHVFAGGVLLIIANLMVEKEVRKRKIRRKRRAEPKR